jgi:hypothetical protein
MVKREIESNPELALTTYDTASSQTQAPGPATSPNKKSKASPRKPKKEDEQEQHSTARAGQVRTLYLRMQCLYPI